MSNLEIYEKGRVVPDEAKKTISGGNLKGFTDINPMWRIRILTELFGPCGFGWKIVDPVYWTDVGANNEVLAFCEIGLCYKINDVWSDPIMGIGGSKMVTGNKNGLVNSDEAYKMAYTDALSVCCKMLGIGASVYWEAGETKYSNLACNQGNENSEKQGKKSDEKDVVLCNDCGEPIKDVTWPNGGFNSAKSLANLTKKKLGVCLCSECYTMRRATDGMQGG